MLHTIVSGGQTGVDRGALEAAYLGSFVIKGYAPRNFVTEAGIDTTLKTRYGLTECVGGYVERTRLNVDISDGTLIMYGTMSGGSLLTYEYCLSTSKPVMLMHVSATDMAHYRDTWQSINTHVHSTSSILELKVHSVLDWVRKNNVHVLNVAGNRESKYRGIQAFTFNFITELIDTSLEG